MTFLNPLLLVAGLGISLPIIAHLLNRHQVRHTPWAAMQFLNRTVRVRSRQLRLRDVLLLCIRCLAVICLVLALARPAVLKSLTWIPGEERAGVVIALDTSFSMQHADAESTRFEQAKQHITAISSRIHSGDPVSLVLLGGKHRVAQRNLAFDEQRFHKMLDQQEPSFESLHLDSVPGILQELAGSIDAHQKEVYFITDVQAASWRSRSARVRTELEDLNRTANVVIVPVTGSAENAAVTDLKLVSGVLRRGTTGRYQATVSNFGSTPLKNVEVTCRVEGAPVDSRQIPLLRAQSSETVSLFVPFHNSGPTQITAEISSDALSADNTRHVVAVVRERVSILCVDGTSGGAGRLISSALLARDDGTEGEDYVVRSVPWLSLPAQDLSGVDVIVMANVPQITADQAEKLKTFVRQGNGLVWFGGDQINVAEWNAVATGQATEVADSSPLLPAMIGPITDSSDALGAGKPLDPSLPDHRLTLPLRSLPGDLYSETRFLKRFHIEPRQSAFSVLNLAGSEAPILVEHHLGRGRVVMITTSAEPTWNNMALTPVFPMLMQHIVTYLAGREFEQPQVVGDALSLSYAEQPDASDAEFDTPSGQTISVPVQEHRNEYVAMLDDSREAGFYVARVSVQSQEMPVAVNVDPGESDVACLSDSEIGRLFGDSRIKVAGTAPELSAAIDSIRSTQSIWRLLMVAGLLLLVLECLFADHLIRRQKKASLTAGGEAPENA